MAVKHTCVQGDSFAYDFSSSGVDSFLTGWEGVWAIVDKLGDGGVTLATGPMVSSVDGSAMELRILPANTAPIPALDYVLVAQLTNASIGFQKEVMQDKFTIIPQGIA